MFPQKTELHNSIIQGVLKIVNYTLKILMQMLQYFSIAFDHFVETTHYKDRDAFKVT